MGSQEKATERIKLLTAADCRLRAHHVLQMLRHAHYCQDPAPKTQALLVLDGINGESKRGRGRLAVAPNVRCSSRLSVPSLPNRKSYMYCCSPPRMHSDQIRERVSVRGAPPWTRSDCCTA